MAKKKQPPAKPELEMPIHFPDIGTYLVLFRHRRSADDGSERILEWEGEHDDYSDSIRFNVADHPFQFRLTFDDLSYSLEHYAPPPIGKALEVRDILTRWVGQWMRQRQGYSGYLNEIYTTHDVRLARWAALHHEVIGGDFGKAVSDWHRTLFRDDWHDVLRVAEDALLEKDLPLPRVPTNAGVGRNDYLAALIVTRLRDHEWMTAEQVAAMPGIQPLRYDWSRVEVMARNLAQSMREETAAREVVVRLRERFPEDGIPLDTPKKKSKIVPVAMFGALFLAALVGRRGGDGGA